MRESLQDFITANEDVLGSAINTANRERQLGRKTTEWRDHRFRVYCMSCGVHMQPYEVASVVVALS